MQRTNEGFAATSLIMETFRLNGLLLEAGDRLTAPLGLTSARWQVLGAIKEQNQPLTVAQIGRRMGLSRQNVQRIATELEKLGFVSFEENPDHKRARLVVLTAACLETLEKLDRVQTRWVNELASGMSDATLKGAIEVLADIRERCQAIEQVANETQSS